MRLILFLFANLCFLSCDRNLSEVNVSAHFSGEIDNPRSNVILLKNSNGKIDSISLNSNNRFYYKIEDLIPGLYEFKHGNEFQVVVIEPGDSLALRLNTRDFDESLAYSGKGSKKNNMLMKLYMERESNGDIIYKSRRLEPEQFEILIDSIISKQMSLLDEFNDDKESSDLYKYISKSIVEFSYYYFKENYPFYHYGYDNLIHYKDLPEGFYKYRDSLKLNEELFTELYAYRYYIFAYVNNTSLNEFYKDGNHKKKFDDESISYNLEKLRLIDSIFKNDDIRNYLLRSVTREYILVTDNTANMQELTNKFLSLSNNEVANEKMLNFLNARINMKSGNKLPSIELVNARLENVPILEIIDKPTIIYFWATTHVLHARNTDRIVKALKRKHPEINFIGINVLEDKPEFWLRALKENRFDTTNQYIFENNIQGAMKLAADLDHVIAVDSEGIIKNIRINLFSDGMEEALLSLEDMTAIAKY